MADRVIGSFDDIEAIEFIKFDKGVVTLRFTSSEFLIADNAFNNTSYTFCVVEGKEDKQLSITSIRLMLKLKEHHPLEGKVFNIERVGVGMDTDYLVVLVK